MTIASNKAPNKGGQNMNTYRIEVKTENGWMHYGKTPISAQAYSIKYQLEQKGYEVRIIYNGQLR